MDKKQLTQFTPGFTELKVNNSRLMIICLWEPEGTMSSCWCILEPVIILSREEKPPLEGIRKSYVVNCKQLGIFKKTQHFAVSVFMQQHYSVKSPLNWSSLFCIKSKELQIWILSHILGFEDTVFLSAPCLSNILFREVCGRPGGREEPRSCAIPLFQTVTVAAVSDKQHL